MFSNFFRNKKKLNIFLIVSILIISLPPRLWKLSELPPVIVDEPANLRDINKLLLFPQFRPTDFEWGYGQATLVHYPAVLLIKSGISDQFIALRLTSVFLSILGLIPFFLIVKRFSNILVAFCTTLIFSFSYYYLQFSRVGWTNIHSLILGLYFIFFIDSLTKSKKISLSLLSLSGILGGLLSYTYRAGELFILAGTALLLVKIFKSEKERRIHIVNLVIVILILVIISYPWLNKILSNWNLYNLRTSVVSIKNAERPYHGLNDNNNIMKYQIITTIKSWILLLPTNGNSGSIENPRYLPSGYPPISFLIIPLYWIGMLIAVKNWRETFSFLFILITALIAGQIMTSHPPNGSRGLIVLPVIYILIGHAFFYLQKRFSSVKYINLILIVFSIIVAILDFLFYQYWMTWVKV